jgi:hypothetical protein
MVNVRYGLNVCGFHIVVLVLLYDKGVSIPSNTTMFDFIQLFYSSNMFRPSIWPSSGFSLYYTTVHILITTAYGYRVVQYNLKPDDGQIEGRNMSLE